MVVHNGGCHCKNVRWRVQAPASVVAWQCSCSDCSMRGNTSFVVPSKRFELLGDSQKFLTTYTFGTQTAKHIFCKICGITSFYVPRASPDGIAVTFRCVDPGTLTHVEVKQFDGQNWENSYTQNLALPIESSKESKWMLLNGVQDWDEQNFRLHMRIDFVCKICSFRLSCMQAPLTR